jgi:hypothetical protein
MENQIDPLPDNSGTLSDDRLRQIESGAPLTDDEMTMYGRASARKNARMRMSPAQTVLYSACRRGCKVRHDAEMAEYIPLKARIKAGEMLSREEFLKVKKVDARINADRTTKMKRYRVKSNLPVQGGKCDGGR